MIGEKSKDFTLEGYLNNSFITRTLSSDYKDKNVVIIFYPHDFDILSPKEILDFSNYIDTFQKLQTEIIFISCDSKYVHKAWVEHDSDMGGLKGNLYPILSDSCRKVSNIYDMLSNTANVCVHGIVILDSQHYIRHIAAYDEYYSHKIDEVIRLIKSFQS